MRHSDSVSHFRYMSQTLRCEDTAISDGAQAASAIITGPLKYSTEFICTASYGDDPCHRNLCSGVSTSLITSDVKFVVAGGGGFLFIYLFWSRERINKGSDIMR